ncbi:hypothetical protein BW730_12375 [Tessaracoccus aquimaris]|uniref:Hyaluronate lyase n=1 Tax=Tessaracoccus aquimaris TaxID=1332264 RepID=A0A1Q2CPZ9_9ACTN|nr:polysaccharide lyase family 8 super-sandwich domain-containing protein [Tessaracoccus aquimaris]AQP48174.1 hypothetical protein BW730_12375 [Tessaracoccus aquimaris]
MGTFSLKRRTFLAGSATIAAATVCTSLPAAAEDEYAELIRRRRDFLTGGEVAASHAGLAEKRATLDAAADDLIATFTRTAGRKHLWSNLPLNAVSTTAEVGNLGVTANQVTALAVAWAAPASKHHGSASLLTDLIGALGFIASVYRAGRNRPGNWWFWEVGLPRQLGDTLVLLGDQVAADLVTSLVNAIRFFAPDPNIRTTIPTLKETGANRADKALACIERGLLAKSPADILLGRDALSDTKGAGKDSLFARVTSGDGFYSDGSFIQHAKLPYVGTYGAVAVAAVGEALAMLGGSTWAVTDPQLGNLHEAVMKSFAPFQWDGRTMDTVRGRAVSRERERDYNSGFAIAHAVLVLGASAPQAQAAQWRSVVKGWLTRMTDQSAATNSQKLAASARLLEVLVDDATEAAAPLVATVSTVAQERMVHHRPDWAVAVNTSSTRIGRYEWGNKENNLGWYQGDGMMFLYHRRDSAQFSDDFWPTVDPYALPGITANSAVRASGLADGTGIPGAPNTYAGGVTAGGSVGTTAMDLVNATGTLTAKKSWFYLEDRVVCVGSEITDTSGTLTRTVLENRGYAKGSLPKVTLNGVEAPAAPVAQQATWALIDGHAGYVSLGIAAGAPQPFSIASEERTGTWQAINSGADTGGSTTPLARDYVRVEYLHHNAGDSYAYEILPLASAERTSSEAESNGVLVSRADSAHVVETADGNTRLAHYFAAGDYDGWSVDAPAAIALRRTQAVTRRAAGAQVIELVVSNPTKNAANLQVATPLDATGRIIEQDPTITVVSESPLTIRCATAATPGAEHRITFASAPTAEPVIVRYLDTEGVVLAPGYSIVGALGDPYSATQVDIEGHVLTEVPANASGVIGDAVVNVDFVFRKVEDPQPSESPSPEPTTSPSPDPTTSPSPSASPTATPTPTTTPRPTAGPTPTAAPSASPSPTSRPTVRPTSTTPTRTPGRPDSGGRPGLPSTGR